MYRKRSIVRDKIRVICILSNLGTDTQSPRVKCRLFWLSIYKIDWTSTIHTSLLTLGPQKSTYTNEHL